MWFRRAWLHNAICRAAQAVAQTSSAELEYEQVGAITAVSGRVIIKVCQLLDHPHHPQHVPHHSGTPSHPKPPCVTLGWRCGAP